MVGRMADSTATLIAAIIAASVGGLGLLWSVVSFLLTRNAQRSSDARAEWSRRFEHAHALALSSDARESASGLKLIEALSRERWATDEDRAHAISILSSLSYATEAPVAELRASILGAVRNPAVAAELERVPPGPKGRFELYADSAGAYRWRLKDANGKSSPSVRSLHEGLRAQFA